MKTQIIPKELQEPKIDGPWRVDKYGARISPFRTFTNVTIFPLDSYDNFIVYKDQNSHYTLKSLSYIFGQTNKHKESINSYIVDNHNLFDQEYRSSISKLSTEFIDLTVVQTLDHLLGYRDKIIKDCFETRNIRPPNKKYDFFVFVLDIDDFMNTEIIRKFNDLFDTANRTGMKFFIITNSVHTVPQKILENIQVQFFLGNENMNDAIDIYGDIQSNGSIGKKKIGLLFDSSNDIYTLKILHNLSHEKSDWKIAKDKAIKNEKDSYENFLNSLIDEDEYE